MFAKRKSKLNSQRRGLLLYWDLEFFENLDVTKTSGFCIKEILYVF